MIAGLISSGRIAWVILPLTLAELAVFALARRGGRPGVGQMLPNILAGDGLLLAWLLAAAHWRLAALALSGALLAHGADVWIRLRGGRRRAAGGRSRKAPDGI